MNQKSPADHKYPPGLRWYALHTNSRHERKVRQALEAQSVEVFLPLYRTWSSRKDRRKKIEKALFPGYLFVHLELTPDTRLAIVRTPSVVGLVGPPAQPAPIPDHEVESIKLLLGSNSEAEPSDRLIRGQQVQVMDGPLRGVIGRVEQGGRGRRIVVAVELLGRAVAADLDAQHLEPYLD